MDDWTDHDWTDFLEPLENAARFVLGTAAAAALLGTVLARVLAAA